ncbi:MAG: hypothetical protein MAG795_00899 [Candidatus Woesearchaeota archaeon]|nr:hypothetical protein [Candidatus Woesearchaeota archaeon]
MAIDFKNLEQEIRQRGKVQTLENGLTLVSEDVPASGLVTGQIVIYTGSGYEKQEDHGVMHFLEHMSFGGSGLYPDRNSRNLQSGIIGLNINAQTGPFSVMYPVSGANDSQYMLQQNFQQAFRIVSDMVFFPNIDEASLQREMSVVQRERIEHAQREESNPFHEVSKTVQERVFGNNPILAKNSLGSEESIARITVQTLRDYHSNFFVANNTLVGMVGDLNGTVSLEGAIGEALTEIPSGERTAPLEIVPEKPYQGREKLDLQSPVPGNANVDIYFQIPPSHSPESHAMTLLSYILGGSPNSLLFQDIRENRGLVYSIVSGIDGHAQTGFLRIQYSVAPDHLDDSLQAVDENIQRLKNGQFNEVLVDAFKAGYLPKVLASLQNPGWIQSELMDRQYVERFGYESTGLQRLESALNLGKQDIVNAANKYLGEDRLTVVVS